MIQANNTRYKADASSSKLWAKLYYPAPVSRDIAKDSSSHPFPTPPSTVEINSGEHEIRGKPCSSSAARENSTSSTIYARTFWTQDLLLRYLRVWLPPPSRIYASVSCRGSVTLKPKRTSTSLISGEKKRFSVAATSFQLQLCVTLIATVIQTRMPDLAQR